MAHKPSKLWMRLDRLDALPALTCPEGYQLRTYQPDDDQYWEHIVLASFQEPISFAHKVASRPSYRPDRVIFCCCDGEPVATASALELDGPEPGVDASDPGYLHMVAALPNQAGHGLGYAVTLAALHQMREAGKEAAVLKTDDFRLPAIRTYLKLGFKPLYRESDHQARWHTIMLRLIRRTVQKE